MDNYGKLWKIWKETAFIKLCSFFIDLLAFELGKFYAWGWGFFASFFQPEGWSFAQRKLVTWGSAGGDGNWSN